MTRGGTAHRYKHPEAMWRTLVASAEAERLLVGLGQEKYTCSAHARAQAGRRFFVTGSCRRQQTGTFHRTSAEGLRVVASLVVFPFSFCLEMLIHVDRRWGVGERQHNRGTVIDNVSYNYMLALKETPRCTILQVRSVGISQANTGQGGQQGKDRPLPVLVCIPLDGLLLVHASAVEVPVEGSICIPPQWLHSQAVRIQPLGVMRVDGGKQKHVSNCVLKSSLLGHKAIVLSHPSCLWNPFTSKTTKNQQPILVR